MLQLFEYQTKTKTASLNWCVVLFCLKVSRLGVCWYNIQITTWLVVWWPVGYCKILERASLRRALPSFSQCNWSPSSVEQRTFIIIKAISFVCHWELMISVYHQETLMWQVYLQHIIYQCTAVYQTDMSLCVHSAVYWVQLFKTVQIHLRN